MSLANTSMVTLVSSSVVVVSLMASGASLMLVHRTVTVAVSVPPLPSAIVYVKLASPTKFAVVSKVKTLVLLSLRHRAADHVAEGRDVERIAIRIGVVGCRLAAVD